MRNFWMLPRAWRKPDPARIMELMLLISEHNRAGGAWDQQSQDGLYRKFTARARNTGTSSNLQTKPGGLRTVLATAELLGFIYYPSTGPSVSGTNSQRPAFTLAGCHIAEPLQLSHDTLAAQMLKLQYPSPYSTADNVDICQSFKVRPLLLVCRVLLEMEQALARAAPAQSTGARPRASLSANEAAILSLLGKDESKSTIKRCVAEILALRAQRGPSKAAFVTFVNNLCSRYGIILKATKGTSDVIKELRESGLTALNYLEAAKILEPIQRGDPLAAAVLDAPLGGANRWTLSSGQRNLVQKHCGKTVKRISFTVRPSSALQDAEQFQRYFGLAPNKKQDRRKKHCFVLPVKLEHLRRHLLRAYYQYACHLAGVNTAARQRVLDKMPAHLRDEFLGEAPAVQALPPSQNNDLRDFFFQAANGVSGATAAESSRHFELAIAALLSLHFDSVKHIAQSRGQDALAVHSGNADVFFADSSLCGIVDAKSGGAPFSLDASTALLMGGSYCFNAHDSAGVAHSSLNAVVYVANKLPPALQDGSLPPYVLDPTGGIFAHYQRITGLKAGFTVSFFDAETFFKACTQRGVDVRQMLRSGGVFMNGGLSSACREELKAP